MRNIESIGRREFLRRTGLGGAGFVLAQAGWSAGETISPPNIVLILADDLGFGDVGCQNAESKIPTPNLDRLAGEGMRFVDAHTPSAVCSPTRYGILTGRYCWRSRLKESVLWPWDPPLIEAERLTLPGLLRQHGYRTACIGKWHLGWNWPFVKEVDKSRDRAVPADAIDWSKPIGEGPITRGFDCYFGDDVPNFPPYVFIENDRTLGVPSAQKPKEMFGSPGPMLPGWKLDAVMPAITRKAVDWVGRVAAEPDSRPFFLYFPLTAPHTPIAPAAEFKGRSQAGDYGDYVAEVDWAVGEILQALSKHGLAENTLVLFTSDNGPENSAYERAQRYQHYSMGSLRGLKRDTWEGGHRVPFIARWPGHIPAGALSREVICLTDLMATGAALVGTALPENAGEDSYNILPALLGTRSARPIREAVVHHSCSGRFAIRRGDWVFIDAPTGDDNREPAWFKEERGYAPHGLPGELYNLTEDLGERKNRYAEHPELVKELKGLLEKYKQEGRSAPGERS